MAKFDSKSFNPQAFGKYMEAIPNVKMNKLRQSRAIANDARLLETFKNNSQTGTVFATIPYFGILGGTPLNYDGVVNLTSQNTNTYEQGVFTYGRMQSWTEADFSYDVTGGADFMGNIRTQVTEYWNGAFFIQKYRIASNSAHEEDRTVRRGQRTEVKFNNCTLGLQSNNYISCLLLLSLP